MRITSYTKSGKETLIDLDSKHKCKCCGKEVLDGFKKIKVELVSLATWDKHECN